MYQNAVAGRILGPGVSRPPVKNFPLFDLNIPDQFRVDLWLQDFNKDARGQHGAGADHPVDHGRPHRRPADRATPSRPTTISRSAASSTIISHSNVWDSSAIFIEEDDAQNGVDHVDGHRSPGYVVSPYAVQNGPTDHTYYTQVNMTRTIEQILGLPPMNQFDLVASPMTDFFLKGTPPAANFDPYVHVPNRIPLDQGTPACCEVNASPAEVAWAQWKTKAFAGKASVRPDVVDADTLNHFDWYDAHEYKVPYPGETTVRMPTEFKNEDDRMREGASTAAADDDGDGL